MVFQRTKKKFMNDSYVSLDVVFLFNTYVEMLNVQKKRRKQIFVFLSLSDNLSIDIVVCTAELHKRC